MIALFWTGLLRVWSQMSPIGNPSVGHICDAIFQLENPLLKSFQIVSCLGSLPLVIRVLHLAKTIQGQTTCSLVSFIHSLFLAIWITLLCIMSCLIYIFLIGSGVVILVLFVENWIVGKRGFGSLKVFPYILTVFAVVGILIWLFHRVSNFLSQCLLLMNSIIIAMIQHVVVIAI